MSALTLAGALSVGIAPGSVSSALAEMNNWDPAQWSVWVDDRTQTAARALSPGLTASAGFYRGDAVFWAPFGALALERESGGTRWGVQGSILWLDGEPFIESEDRDAALRTFVSAYGSMNLGSLIDSDTSAGHVRIASRLGARLDVEHVFPQLEIGAGLSAVLAPSPSFELFAHLTPSMMVPDADYSLATTDVSLLFVPEPWMAGDFGTRIFSPSWPERIEIRARGGVGSTSSDVGLRLALEPPRGLALSADLSLHRGYGGTVERRIADTSAGWGGLVTFQAFGEDVEASPEAGVRVGRDRFGSVEDSVLEVRGGIRLAWGATARIEVGYRLDMGDIENRPARYDFAPEEQRFLDSAIRVRDSTRALVTRLDMALEGLRSGSPEAIERAARVIDGSAQVLGTWAAVLENADRFVPSRPLVTRLASEASDALRSAEGSLRRLLDDPSGARSAEAIASVLGDVRHAVTQVFLKPIVGSATLDDLITGVATVPRSFTKEVAAEEINDLIRDLANDDDFGFLLSEIDVLLLADWKDHSRRGLEPVTANDVFRFFANELADETLDLLDDGLAEITDQYQVDPQAVLRKVPNSGRPAARRFLDSLAELRAKDLLDPGALQRMMPSNTLTEDTAITLANLINGKVLRVHKAMTDFRARLAVRQGRSIDRILTDDLDEDWRKVRAGSATEP